MTAEQVATSAVAWAQYPLVMIMVGILFFLIRSWAQDRKEWLEYIKHMSDSHTKVTSGSLIFREESRNSGSG